MSANKSTKKRRASEHVYSSPRPALRLLKPKSECSTTDIITELSQEVKVMLREQNRRREAVTKDDEPDAA